MGRGCGMKWFNWFKKDINPPSLEVKTPVINRDFKYGDIIWHKGRKGEFELDFRELSGEAGVCFGKDSRAVVPYNELKPVVRCKAFQPDWNQAPKGATMWRMAGSGDCYWGLMADCGGYSTPVVCGEAPTFGYNGCYTKSFRRRP